MGEPNNNSELLSRLTATETLIRSLSEDIKQVALAVKDVADSSNAMLQDLRVSTSKSISKVHESAETRANNDRTRILTVSAIILTILLPIFGIIGMAIGELNDDVGQIRNFRVQDAYERGLIAGKSNERVLRLQRLERQMDFLLLNQIQED